MDGLFSTMDRVMLFPCRFFSSTPPHALPPAVHQGQPGEAKEDQRQVC